jgi:beta-galactosidase
MSEAQFSVIRVGESVWSTWEPEDGQFTLDWLQPTLDGAHERGIGVILGTPTYAVPPWLARLYPEIAGEEATGRRIGWGARQEMDFTHPAFRFYAERIIRRVVERYAAHPAVIGYQVDNEPGPHLLHNHGVFQRFVNRLRDKYGDVQTLNDEWGLVYWSHRLTDWADLWTPDGNAQPQYEQAWRRFQADLVTEYISWQADIVRECARPGQFVTTCIAYDRPAVADADLTRALDVTAGNLYYGMQDDLLLPARHDRKQRWHSQEVWAFYRAADRIYSSRQESFFVTETNAHAIGAPWGNQPGYDGQWRQAAWALVARGASMIEYWHWRTTAFGTELYWGGVLPHSGRPGRTYREIARIGGELDKAGDLVAGLVPDADVAMLYSQPSDWAMAAQPPLAAPDVGPNLRSYETIFDAYYRGAFDAGLQTRTLHAQQAVVQDPAEVAVHRRAARGRRRRTRRLRPPTLRAVRGHHHQELWQRPRHLRRHHPQPCAERCPVPMARAGRRAMEAAADRRHLRRCNRTDRPTAPVPAQLDLAADGGAGTRRRARHPGRHRPRTRLPGAPAHGTCASCWRLDRPLATKSRSCCYDWSAWALSGWLRNHQLGLLRACRGTRIRSDRRQPG